ncbi:hypothetical protein CTI12_AA485160 [Artemisia annua]|uniref:Uncharacterized protein n=1 Tax=Artemisia annua TaxID=35608 RepID=A0A2U1LHR9_ARTAN|nr:hypothetical protein CTI12_AA485160 [Artemisia annua]
MCAIRMDCGGGEILDSCELVAAGCGLAVLTVLGSKGCEVQTSDDRHVFCCPICTTQHCNSMLLPHKCPSASHGRPNIVPDSIDAAKLIKLLLRMLESRNQTAT